MQSTPPDTDLVARIKERLDLAEQVISPDIGPPQRRGHRLAWVCPFHPDRHPSLFLNPDKQSYRCFGCGARGDAFTWVMARRNWAFRDALVYLAGLVGLDGEVGKRPAEIPVKRRPAPQPSPPSKRWQARAQVILQRAQAVLWENAGAPGRAYLADRGLHEATLRTWGLGWCPRDVFDDPARWGLTGKRIYLPRGVVIPHWINDELWALKVRRFAGDAPAPAEPWGKYGGPRGGQIALFGLDMLRGGDRPLFLVEAELDALLLWQAAGDLVDVLALGSAGRTLPTRWLAPLLPYAHIYAALDADGAGTLNAARLTALSARIALACIPAGNDVTEFAQQGGDVRRWATRVIQEQVERERRYCAVRDKLICLTLPPNV
ncbi:MAG: CHC2 zinc finger domain-containing protein [Anaerolineales bacterium]